MIAIARCSRFRAKPTKFGCRRSPLRAAFRSLLPPLQCSLQYPLLRRLRWCQPVLFLLLQPCQRPPRRRSSHRRHLARWRLKTKSGVQRPRLPQTRTTGTARVWNPLVGDSGGRSTRPAGNGKPAVQDTHEFTRSQTALPNFFLPDSSLWFRVLAITAYSRKKTQRARAECTA